MYEGDWVRGKRHGKGSLQYRSPGPHGRDHVSVYVGNFDTNRRHGTGKMVYASGNVYEGEWQDDKRHGHGSMVWQSQNESYTGEWRNGIQHGHGEHTWFAKRFVATNFVQHNKYIGQFVDGKRHGTGTFQYASGATYVGEWADDKKHGDAVYTSETGTVFSGKFVNDRKAASGAVDKASEAVRVVQFEFNILDLEPDVDKADVNLREIDTILCRYISEIRGCYNKYRLLGAAGNEHNTRVLTRLQFLRFLKDLDIEVLGLSTADANRVIHPACKRWSLHGPCDVMLQRDFYEALIRIGWRVFRSTASPTSPHPIADCFLKLVLRSREYDSLKGYLFQNDDVAQQLVAHTTDFEKLFLKYADHRADSSDHTLRWRGVLFMARDVGLFSEFADRSAIPVIVNNLHSKMVADDCTDLRYEVSLLEVMEFFAGCAMSQSGRSLAAGADMPEEMKLEVLQEDEDESETKVDAGDEAVGADASGPQRRTSSSVTFHIRLSEQFDGDTHASPFTTVSKNVSRVNEMLELVF
mmetsp:Transcript_29688/g.88817  ORF Transcript_29688/g.88817 Transcript_29688/m.88817 type:complete len:524 (-) Transcript_29688:61-1632(-)